jgi:hypothetical protein
MTEREPLAAKLAKVIGDLPGFTKDGRNSHQNYNFVSIEQMKKEIVPALAAAGIICYPFDVRETINPRDRGSEIHLVMKWVITDGTEILEPYPETIGQAVDTQDKSGSKGTTDALKNLYKTTFGVFEKGDDNDENAPFDHADMQRQPAPPPDPKLVKKKNEIREILEQLANQSDRPVPEVIQVMIDDKAIPAAWLDPAQIKTVADAQNFIDAAKAGIKPQLKGATT